MDGLAMRTVCMRCKNGLRMDDIAFICSYECTFCADCFEDLEHRCPNCGGELMRRPKRHLAQGAAACDVTDQAS